MPIVDDSLIYLDYTNGELEEGNNTIIDSFTLDEDSSANLIFTDLKDGPNGARLRGWGAGLHWDYENTIRITSDTGSLYLHSLTMANISTGSFQTNDSVDTTSMLDDYSITITDMNENTVTIYPQEIDVYENFNFDYNHDTGEMEEYTINNYSYKWTTPNTITFNYDTSFNNTDYIDVKLNHNGNDIGITQYLAASISGIQVSVKPYFTKIWFRTIYTPAFHVMQVECWINGVNVCAASNGSDSKFTDNDDVTNTTDMPSNTNLPADNGIDGDLTTWNHGGTWRNVYNSYLIILPRGYIIDDIERMIVYNRNDQGITRRRYYALQYIDFLDDSNNIIHQIDQTGHSEDDYESIYYINYIGPKDSNTSNYTIYDDSSNTVDFTIIDDES